MGFARGPGVHGEGPAAAPCSSGAGGFSSSRPRRKSGRPSAFIHRPRTPSFEPATMPPPTLKTAMRRPSDPQTASRYWCSSRETTLRATRTLQTHSSVATDASHMPSEEKERLRTPKCPLLGSCECCSSSHEPTTGRHRRSVWSLEQETIRGSYPALAGEDTMLVTMSQWALRVFSSISDEAFQICIWPASKPRTSQSPLEVYVMVTGLEACMSERDLQGMLIFQPPE
mmetsp:Transcript_17187/g.45808  ORF Transcript_17187/g.45808 Transcript_17187/m.45808 type:complete len:228 (-) Transcript_17187:541-1224(-)